MSKILFIVLLFSLLFSVGCVQQNFNPLSQPQTTTPTTNELSCREPFGDTFQVITTSGGKDKSISQCQAIPLKNNWTPYTDIALAGCHSEFGTNVGENKNYLYLRRFIISRSKEIVDKNGTILQSGNEGLVINQLELEPLRLVSSDKYGSPMDFWEYRVVSVDCAPTPVRG